MHPRGLAKMLVSDACRFKNLTLLRMGAVLEIHPFRHDIPRVFVQLPRKLVEAAAQLRRIWWKWLHARHHAPLDACPNFGEDGC